MFWVFWLPTALWFSECLLKCTLSASSWSHPEVNNLDWLLKTTSTWQMDIALSLLENLSEPKSMQFWCISIPVKGWIDFGIVTIWGAYFRSLIPQLSIISGGVRSKVVVVTQPMIAYWSPHAPRTGSPLVAGTVDRYLGVACPRPAIHQLRI